MDLTSKGLGYRPRYRDVLPPYLGLGILHKSFWGISQPRWQNLHMHAHFLQDVQVSCTSELARQKSCKILEPVILQDEILQGS